MLSLEPEHRPPGWHPSPGEIYLCRLDKERPAIILKPSRVRDSRRVWVLPLTTQNKQDSARRFALSSGEGGLTKPCWARLDACTELDLDRIDVFFGKLSDRRLAQIAYEVDLYFL